MSTHDKQACDLLLTGGSVITVDDERRVLEPGAVAVTLCGGTVTLDVLGVA